jgi:uncharacterized Zn-binding protein involved in type VI secretion
MPAIARKDGVDRVNTVHVSVGDADSEDGIACDASPQVIGTQEGSTDVFVEEVGFVRRGDKEESHTIPGCSTHQTGLTVKYSPNVFANNKNIARLGDIYGCTAQIVTVTQNTVFAND